MPETLVNHKPWSGHVPAPMIALVADNPPEPGALRLVAVICVGGMVLVAIHWWFTEGRGR